MRLSPLSCPAVSSPAAVAVARLLLPTAATMAYPRFLPRRIVPGAGRGSGYSSRRRRVEWFLACFYGGGWAARTARRLGFQRGPVLRRETLRFRSWPAGAPPLLVGFASDFHAGPTTSEELLALAVDRLAEARPDLVLLGGDYVSFSARYALRVSRLVGELRPRLGVYGVLGNHDLWALDRHVVELLEKVGVEVLVNRGVRLADPWSEVTIAGLDDFTTGEPDPDRALADAGSFVVALMHDPSTVLALAGRRFELALAGHTHGGQIALPGGRPLIVPDGPLARSHSRGLFSLDGDVGAARDDGEDPSRLLVSVGLGCSELPIRLFADPEVWLLELGPAEPGERTV